MKTLSVLPSQGAENASHLAVAAGDAASGWLQTHPDQVSKIIEELKKISNKK
ncbi:MAG: hypothetical protein HFE66_07735 [Clostridiales bacterium]|jgi:hypothetical protein|nr:hypothetical protein [Clostridiales bacterium]